MMMPLLLFQVIIIGANNIKNNIGDFEVIVVIQGVGPISANAGHRINVPVIHRLSVKQLFLRIEIAYRTGNIDQVTYTCTSSIEVFSSGTGTSENCA